MRKVKKRIRTRTPMVLINIYNSAKNDATRKTYFVFRMADGSRHEISGGVQQ